MPKRPSTRKRQTGVFNFFAGVSGALQRWSGSRPQGNPAAVRPDMFRVLENVRYSGASIVERGGQEKLTATGFGSPIRGIFDTSEGEVASAELGDELSSRPYIYMALGVSHELYDVPKNFSVDIALPGLSANNCFSFGDNARSESFNTRKIYVVVVEAGATEVSLYSVRASGKGFRKHFSISVEAAGDTFVSGAASVTEYLGKIWFSVVVLKSGGASTEVWVYSWDGTTAVRDHTHSGGSQIVGALLYQYREDLFLGFYRGPSAGSPVKRREIDGTWTSLTLPGTLTQFAVTSMRTYKDVLYVGGTDIVTASNHGAYVLSWDGTTFAIANGPIAGAGQFDEVVSLDKYQGNLYYGHVTRSSTGTFTGNVCVLGMFDGTTWTDAHKDLTAQFGDGFVAGASLRNARGELWFLGYQNNSGSAISTLIRTRDGAVTGTWEVAGVAAGDPLTPLRRLDNLMTIV